jgi:hypothetical protein
MMLCAGSIGAVSVPVSKKVMRANPSISRTVSAAKPSLAGSKPSVAGIACTPVVLASATLPLEDAPPTEPVSLPDLTGFSGAAGSSRGGFMPIAGGSMADGVMPPLSRLDSAPPGLGGPGILFPAPSIEDIGNNAVPEPGTWTLMIGGFRVVGMAMRARRQEPEQPTAL